MKKSLVIEPNVQKQLRALPKEQRASVVLSALEVGHVFGKPHEHTGLGIRKLRRDLFECRAGLDLRVVFRVSPEELIIRFVGTHDEVQKFLRSI